jgi:hypothetical protein
MDTDLQRAVHGHARNYCCKGLLAYTAGMHNAKKVVIRGESRLQLRAAPAQKRPFRRIESPCHGGQIRAEGKGERLAAEAQARDSVTGK